MKRGKLEDLFKDKLSDYESDDLIPSWDEIERKLPVPDSGKSTPFYRRYYWVAAFWTGLLCPAAYFLYDSGTDIQVMTLTETLNEDKYQEITTVMSQESPVIAEAVPETNSEANLITKGPVYIGCDQLSSVSVAAEKEVAQKNISSPFYQNSTVNSSGSEEKETVTESLINRDNGLSYQNTYASNHQKRAAGIKKNKKNQGDVSVALLASNFSTNDGIEKDLLVLSLKNSEDMILEEPSRISTKSPDLVYSHRLPVSLGVNVGFKLPYKFSLETGLTYTYHYSEYTIPQNYVTKGTQSLYYLGIPLNVAYDIVEWKALRFYAAAGTRIDINLKAKQNSFQLNEEYPHSFRDKKPVWSLRAKAGLAVKVLDWLQIYGEPGVAHYFYNGNTRSYWSDNAITFDLNFGLRAFL